MGEIVGIADGSVGEEEHSVLSSIQAWCRMSLTVCMYSKVPVGREQETAAKPVFFRTHTLCLGWVMGLQSCMYVEGREDRPQERLKRVRSGADVWLINLQATFMYKVADNEIRRD